MLDRFKQDDLRDRLLRTLSDHSRRRIIRSLFPGPLHVGNTALHLDDPTRVGYHLRVLRHAGIVKPIKGPGRHVSYEYDRASAGRNLACRGRKGRLEYVRAL